MTATAEVTLNFLLFRCLQGKSVIPSGTDFVWVALGSPVEDSLAESDPIWQSSHWENPILPQRILHLYLRRVFFFAFWAFSLKPVWELTYSFLHLKPFSRCSHRIQAIKKDINSCSGFELPLIPTKEYTSITLAWYVVQKRSEIIWRKKHTRKRSNGYPLICHSKNSPSF